MRSSLWYIFIGSYCLFIKLILPFDSFNGLSYFISEHSWTCPKERVLHQGPLKSTNVILLSLLFVYSSLFKHAALEVNFLSCCFDVCLPSHRSLSTGSILSLPKLVGDLLLFFHDIGSPRYHASLCYLYHLLFIEKSWSCSLKKGRQYDVSFLSFSLFSLLYL